MADTFLSLPLLAGHRPWRVELRTAARGRLHRGEARRLDQLHFASATYVEWRNELKVCDRGRAPCKARSTEAVLGGVPALQQTP